MHRPEPAVDDDKDGEATTRIQPAQPDQVLAILEEEVDDTTVLHRYQPEPARSGWFRRILGWFRRS